MSIELEYRLRRLLRSVLEKVGTAPVSLALAALAIAYLSVAAVWGRSEGSQEAAGALVVSFAYDLLAGLLLLDGGVAFLRAIPTGRDPSGSVALRLPSPWEWGTLLLRAAHLLLGIAFAVSLLSRDVLTLRVAEGETATGEPGQFVDRGPPRQWSPGPFPVSFTVDGVQGALREDGTTGDLSVRIRARDGGSRTLTRVWPLWSGWGRILAPQRAGYTLRYSIAVDKGGVLDSAFAKLDLLPRGTWQEVRSEVVPHVVALAIPPGPAASLSERPPLRAVVFRAGLLVGEGNLDAGQTVSFDGLVLSVPEVRRWVEFRMVNDLGYFIAWVSGLTAMGGAVLRRAAKARKG